MSGFDYARMAATSTKLLKRFGQAVTITRTDTMGAVTTLSSIGVKAATVQAVLEGASVDIGDDLLLLDPKVEPQPGDRIAYNGGSGVLLDPITAINPAGTVCLYEAHARPG